MSIYSTVQDHHSMVFDNIRNDFYDKAINDEVTEQSVVLDLGAGLGLHGLMAAKSGAKKVYLVEPASIIDITRQIVESNNLSERVECIKGKIEEVELPEKVDCIISVLTGNFLLAEDLLPSLFYARDHFLKPGGKLIPDRAKMEVVPVTAENYYAEHIDCWSSNDDFDINYELVRKFSVNSLYYDYHEERKEEFLAEPAELLDIDFMTATKAACNNRVEVKIIKDGVCHGWLGWFQARLGDKWLSTSPNEEQVHWRQVFLPLNQPIKVKKEDKMVFELNRPEFGEWTWSVSIEGNKERHSTFFSTIVSPDKLGKLSNSYKANLSQKGSSTLYILQKLDGTQSTTEIAAQVLKKYPKLFKTTAQTEYFVKKIIDRYS